MGKTLGYGEITVANMTEPFTVMLTNEAQQFATDSNRKVTSAQSYYTDIIVIRGSQERTDYTIGNITSGSGITVSKNSKRVTFSVSAGTTIGADAGVIEIPITLDGQTVKKQFSWSCGKQGPQGVKGDPGTSVKITSKSVTYQTSTSGTTAPTGTWSTTVPTVNNGQYLWTKTTVQYSDGNKTEAYSVSYKGTNGTNGTSVTVSKTEVTYQVSASGTTAPTGTWSTTMPSCDQGQYLWTKTYVKYSDGKDTTSYSVSYKGVDGEKFAFNMLRETNQGSKHWVNLGASGKYSVESITTDDNINAAKLICTEAIASNEWQFCDFSDYEMLKSLKASTTYTLSYDIKANRSGKILHNIKTGGGQKVFFANDIACKVLGNETWEHVSLKMTSGTTLPNLDGQVIYMFGDALSKVGYSIIKNLKLTEGIVDTPWAPHPEDLEGRGVSETVQYYLATSQASGVTSSTSGWSTDITTQKLTADKKYLWNCYQTKYSDGTSEPISTPKVIGVYGDKGTSTKIIRTSYEYTQTNIDKFSTSGYSGVWGVNDATTGLKVGDSVLLKVKNTTKCSDCLIFANITAIPSNYSLTCTSYGVIDNGSDGQDGAGFHWNLLKYSGDLSKQVLGGAGTYTATVESIEDKTTPSGQAEKITYTVQGTGGKFIQTGKYIKEGDIKQGKTYTVSVWCKCSSIKSTGVINAEFLDNKTYVNPTLSTEWQQYVVTGVANKDVTSTSSASAISFYYSDNMSVGDIFYISSPKVEEGDKASPWCTTYEETLAKNLSITPSSQYFKSTDGGKTFAPDTIAIKPTIQGEISFGKWQYSIDGGVSFADVVSGQKGLTISNNVLTVNKDSSLYSDAVTMVTFRAVANDSSFYDTCSIAKIYDVSDIGDGRNLIQKSQLNPIDGAELSLDDYTKNGTVIFTNKSGNSGFSFDSYNNYQPNSKYVLSYYFTKTSGTMNSFGGSHNGKGVVYTSFFVDDKVYDTASYAGGSSQIGTILNDGKRHRIVVCYTTPDTIATDTSVNYTFIQPGRGNTNPNFGVKIEELKLEKGSSPTGWSPAPEDLQTAILSTKSEISDVSLKVDKNKQAIEQRVEKTTYQQDLNLVKGDISKANEGLNKWRYEIYPKSLFASEYQGKSTMDVFAKNTNLTPSQSVLINDTDLSIAWNYDNNYIGYALTFAKFSAAKSVAITFAHDDGAHIYLNGKLIGGSDAYNNKGESLTLGFVKGWNCIEVVVNEGASTEGFKLGTTISAISECQLMNCYYGTPVARQSHITNQLVENTTNIKGISTKVSKVTSVIGDNGENFTSFKNDYSDFKQTMNGFKTTVGQTYVTKDDFNGLEIGGRNLLLYSQTIRAHKDYYDVGWLTDEVETFNGCPVWSVKNQWGRLVCLFKSHVIDRGLVKVGDTLTYSLYAKTNNASGKSINCSYRFKGNANAYWFNDSAFNVDTSWARYSVTFTVTKDMLATDTYMNEIGFGETASMSGDDKVYYACPKLERGTKATDYTPAPEDNEINGQNLVSNLPSNWEQGGINGGQAVGSTYASIKSSTAYRIRIKDIFSVSGNITVSAGGTTTNSSKETLSFYGTLYDAKKGLLRETGWKSFPSTINCCDAKYMSIILRWGDGTKTQITPSDISQICLKIERGTSATPFTLAPEDVNGKIVNVETIANQTANKFEWIVKGGDSSSNFTLTDRVADLVAERINFKGLVTFSGLSTDAKNEIGKVAQSKVDGLEVGGRNLIINSNLSRTLTNVTNDGCSNMTVVSDSVYGHALKFTAVNQRRVFWATSNVWVKDKTYTVSFVAKSSVTGQKIRPSRSTADWGDDITLTTSYARYTTKITSLDTNAGGALSFSCTNAVGDITITNVKLEVGNKATDWTPAPEDVSQDATNKASQALTDAKNYSSNAVNWVTNNGSSTTSLNSMVKKWTDGAVSDTTQINGGWIKANTITASKIAVGDFTNYADINESNTYGFSVEKTTDGVWFSKDGSKLTRDNYISKMYSCEPGQTFYVEYDISNTIKDSTEYKAAGIMLFGCDGTQTVKWYQRIGAVVGTAAGTVTHMSQQLTMPSGTRFFYVVLQIEGFQPFTGTLKIRNLSVRKAVTGAVIVDGSITADKIATDAIKSRNYISSGGTQGSFLNLSDGSFQSPNLSWDANGNLIAKNANLSGEITATNGSIAGWTIISNKMYTTGSGKYTGIGKYGSAYAFWAGATSNDNGNSAVFKVSHTGKLTATDADITGTITATNGKIGRYDITSTYLMTNSGSNASGIGGNQAFWAGAEDSNSAPFRVGYDGVLWAENAAIRGSIETGNLGDEGDTVSIINGHIGIQGTSNNVEIYSTGFKFGIDGDYYLMSVSEGVKCYRNLYATDFVADGWLYCSEVHSSGAVVIGADSESFYWAHGYQIARGTSWGGVCVGDDSQQLRLYGSSIWASHSISTSDENLKENFTTLDQYENFYMNLNPIGFNYIGDYDGKKTHFGFGAHKTEDVLESEGYDADKFAVVTHRPLVQEDIEKRFGKDVEVDIETEYGVSYTEFIALNTHMIQKTRRELTKVKQEKADLEVRLQAIEAKLGL